jgi:hypothetical protein
MEALLLILLKSLLIVGAFVIAATAAGEQASPWYARIPRSRLKRVL